MFQSMVLVMLVNVKYSLHTPIYVNMHQEFIYTVQRSSNLKYDNQGPG